MPLLRPLETYQQRLLGKMRNRMCRHARIPIRTADGLSVPWGFFGPASWADHGSGGTPPSCATSSPGCQEGEVGDLEEVQGPRPPGALVTDAGFLA